MNNLSFASRILSAAALFTMVFFLIPTAGHSMEWNGIRLSPEAGISGTYDDNITFKSDEEVDDFITTIDAGLKAAYETRLTRIELISMLHYHIFASNDQYDNLSADVNFDWKQELTQYDRIRIRDHYLAAEEPTSYAEAFNRNTGRLSFQRNHVWIDYEHDFTSQWAGTARYENEITTFSEGVLSDSAYHSFGGGVVYHLTSRTDLTGDYDHESRDFDGGDDASAHHVSGGIKHHLTEWMHVEGRAGADFIRAYNGDDLTEPRLSAKLTVEANRTTRIEAMIEQAHSLNSYTQDVFDHWQTTGTYFKEWSERLRTTASGFYGEGKYVLLHTDDTFIGAGVSLSYDLTENLEANMRYEFTKVTTTDTNYGYTKNIALIGLTLKF